MTESRFQPAEQECEAASPTELGNTPPRHHSARICRHQRFRHLLTRKLRSPLTRLRQNRWPELQIVRVGRDNMHKLLLYELFCRLLRLWPPESCERVRGHLH